MTRASSIDTLPEAVRAEIGRLLTGGATIDAIVEHLRGLHGTRQIAGFDAAPSRSAMGRHVKKLAAVGERLRRSREVAEALVRELGDAGVSKTVQLNIELLHGAVFDLFNAGDGEGDADGRAALAGNPEGVMMLAKAVESLTRASKTDVEFAAKLEAQAAEKTKRAATAAVEAIGRERGLSAETLAAIRGGILGVGVRQTSGSDAAVRPGGRA